MKVNLSPLLVQENRCNNTNETQRLLALGESNDELTFNNIRAIIKSPISYNSWDSGYIYRATVVKVDNYYNFYYSANNKSNVWGIGLIQVENLHELSN